MTSSPRRRAPTTSGRKASFISGAPPVMSSVWTCGEAARSWTMRSAVSTLIVSFRFGDDSTWQCVHAWLQ
eukprot:462741-Prymnesium_polylepis.1